MLVAFNAALPSTSTTLFVNAVVVPVFVFPANRVSDSVLVYVVALSAFKFKPVVLFNATVFSCYIFTLSLSCTPSLRLKSAVLPIL